jgi:Phosphotransferase enzyme family
MCRYAKAQVRHPVAGDIGIDFRELVRVNLLIDELPDLRDRTLRAFERAVDRLQVFPGAWCHRDLVAANICERGVIDLEGVGRGYAGYDVIGAHLEPDLWGGGHAYSPRQREQCLTPVDEIFAAHGLPAPSAYAREFVFCKAINTATGRHGLPGQQQWLYNRYRSILNAYEQ